MLGKDVIPEEIGKTEGLPPNSEVKKAEIQ